MGRLGAVKKLCQLPKGGGRGLCLPMISLIIWLKKYQTYCFFLNSSIHFKNFGLKFCFLFTKFDYSWTQCPCLYQKMTNQKEGVLSKCWQRWLYMGSIILWLTDTSTPLVLRFPCNYKRHNYNILNEKKKLCKIIHDYFDIFPTLQCSLDHRLKIICDI